MSKSKGKAPAWVDPSDAAITVSLASDNRLRKLRDEPTEDEVDGNEYESRLRRQYEKINPTPDWASSARDRLHKRQKRRHAAPTSDSEGEDAENVEDLLNTTGGLLNDPNERPPSLPSGQLSIERLRDANQAATTEGLVKMVRFHPTVPVLLTAGSDRRLRLFNVDGLTNPLLQTLHIPSLPATNAHFHPSGSSILLTGPRPFYYTYDLQSGRALQSPRGLWLGAAGGEKGEDRSMEVCAFSPDGGLVAIGGRNGYVHLLDWNSGGGQVVGSLKTNASVKAVGWVPGKEERELMTVGQNSEVYLWDVGSKRCIGRWKDDGAYGASVLDCGRRGDYYAIGSNTGIVNVYGSDAGSPFSATATPKPLKTITNLTTPISTVRFDPSSQILAIASDAKKDQLRLVHLPSLTTFANWPTSGTPLSRVTSVDFSAGSEYVAIGNNRGRVLLYHLRYFAPA